MTMCSLLRSFRSNYSYSFTQQAGKSALGSSAAPLTLWAYYSRLFYSYYSFTSANSTIESYSIRMNSCSSTISALYGWIFNLNFTPSQAYLTLGKGREKLKGILPISLAKSTPYLTHFAYVLFSLHTFKQESIGFLLS